MLNFILARYLSSLQVSFFFPPEVQIWERLVLIPVLAASPRSVFETDIMKKTNKINEQKIFSCFTYSSKNAVIAYFSHARKVKHYFLCLRILLANCV